MVEWVEWSQLSQQHTFKTVDNETNCMVCGNGPDNHWYPKGNPKKLLDDVADIVDEYNRKLLE